MAKKKKFKIPEKYLVKCPKCKSKNVVKMGHVCIMTESAAKWFCNDCGKQWEEGNWNRVVNKAFLPGFAR